MINLFHYKAKSDFKQKFICFDWTLYNHITTITSMCLTLTIVLHIITILRYLL